jgi:SAM-dependent methyltransferase
MQHFLSDLIQADQARAVLDFGGDKGQHIPTMFSHCQRYVYDISNLNSVKGVTITNDLGSIGKVDFVMASNVLEHLPYPGKALDEIRQVCEADTLVFIDVPLEMNDSHVVEHDKTPMMFHEHCNYFNSRSLAALMTAHGFTPLKLLVLNVDFGWASGNQIFVAAKLS